MRTRATIAAIVTALTPIAIPQPAQAASATCVHRASKVTSHPGDLPWKTWTTVRYRSCTGVHGRRWVAVYSLTAGYDKTGTSQKCKSIVQNMTSAEYRFVFYAGHERHMYLPCDTDTYRKKTINVDADFGRYYYTAQGMNRMYHVKHTVHIDFGRVDPDVWTNDVVMRVPR